FHVTGVQTCALPICARDGSLTEPILLHVDRGAVADAELEIARRRRGSVLCEHDPRERGTGSDEQVRARTVAVNPDGDAGERGFQIGRASCRESVYLE